MPDKQEITKETILKSAKELFSKFGPKKTTVDEIAKQAGVGKGTIYYHFEDKEDIFLNVVKREAGELLERLKKAVMSYENPELKLKAFFIERLRGFYELVNLSWLEEMFSKLSWREVVDEWMRFENQQQELFEEILKDGNEKGIFEIEDIKVVARSLFTFLKSTVFRAEPGKLEEKEQELESLWEVLLRGLETGRE